MPIPFYRFGGELHREFRKQDLEFANELRDSMLSLEDTLRGLSARIVNDIFDHPLPNEERLARRLRTYLSYFQTAANREYDMLARRVARHQQDAFLTSWRMFGPYLKRLYLKKFGTPATKAATPAHAEQTTGEEQWDHICEGGISYVTRGTAHDEFKKYLSDQLDTGQAPANLIRTLSPEHVRLIQREALNALTSGIGHGESRDNVIRQLTNSTTDRAIRDTMEYNVMRISRTSYQQAANAYTSGWSSDNSELVAYMERVADGNPCMACVALDRTQYDVGATLDDHPNGMCCAPETYVLCEEYVQKDLHPWCLRRRRIMDVVVGDRVITHLGVSKRVTAVSDREYSGDMVWISIGHRILKITPEHPVLVWDRPGTRWVDAGVLTAEDELVLRQSDGWNHYVQCSGQHPDSIWRVPYTGKVYNLQVEEDETYVAEGVVVHNCVLVPVLKTPSEMGLSVPQDVEQALVDYQSAGPEPMMDRFMALSDQEQRKLFGNDSLYDWWKDNGKQVSVTDLVMRRKGSVGMISYTDAVNRWGEKITTM